MPTIISKENLILYLKELSKILKKRKSERCEIILVGGASIVLNYSFRFSTDDVDVRDRQGILMNDLVNEIADKYQLRRDWINTDFIHTLSYSDKIIQYSAYYGTFNNVLEVRTIKDEYLIAMKMVSARVYKHDMSDICGIINEMIDQNKTINMEMIKKAIVDLYGKEEAVEEDVYRFVEEILANPDIYLTIDQKEKNTFEEMKEANDFKNKKVKAKDFLNLIKKK